MDAPFMIEKHNHAGWLAARMTGIGASDAAALFGCHPWQSEYALWAEKRGLVPEGEVVSDAAEWGTILEGPISEWYARTTGRELSDPGRTTICRSVERPHLVCTLDRVILPTTEQTPGVLEVKTASAWKADEWEDEPPIAYQAQVQHQLAVTGWSWGALVALVGGQRPHIVPVERNQAFIDLLCERADAFWRRVQSGEAPSADGHPATTAALKALHPADDGSEVPLPAEAEEWAARLAEAKAREKAAKEAGEDFGNRLRAAIGAATFGVLPSGGRYSYKTQNRAGYTVQPSTCRVLRRMGK